MTGEWKRGRSSADRLVVDVRLLAEIEEMRAAGMTQEVIAEHFGISRSRVGQLIQRGAQ